ncbi:ABC transporter permease [Prodigiosinella aquatilis]|nr:ABC transporter permease [Prodigiosinella sp. LS101]WJV54137.1 ABC transporter permease [Prodigiosinella sp. LS101]WJV58500.1 ABC transporter permease [Pectobacteriaceae bacterium C111]
MTSFVSRAWLLDETPTTRRQAVWGQRYRLWLGLRTNPLAMVGLMIIVSVLLLSLAAPLLTPYSPGFQDLSNRLAAPSIQHWLGTDELGRDVYSRILYGGRTTLGMVIAVVTITAPIGLLVGCIAGYIGGWLDKILMRLTDIFLSFPRLVLALAFVAALKPGVESAILAIALTAWPPYARLARAETMQYRYSDFIAANRLTGATPMRIILRHIMPLCLPSLIVRITLDMSSIIITAASLGFLGMGAQPPSPEWGTMIATARRFLFTEWWVPLMPCIAIFLTSLAFNFLGDGLRDVLDPKER